MANFYANYPVVGSGGGGGGGTVTSVALTAPGIFTVGGSPVTTSGTLSLTLANESANTVFAGPVSGGAAAPTFRALVVADIPALPYVSTVLPSGDIIVGNGSNVATAVVMSGDATISNTGALTIANLAITNAKIANATIDLTTKVTGVLPVANGGTSLATLTLNNVILGNGTSVPLFVAPGTSGNVLTSNGTTWTSSAAVDTGITQLTGDVTAGPGSGSQVATIANNAVSNAKLAQMPTLTIKGNNTGGTANALDLTVAQVNTMLGDILANGTVAMAASLNLGTNKIINVVDPTAAQDAATKNYVDVVASSLNPKQAVYAATIGSNLVGTYNNGAAGVGATFTITATGAFTLDGTTPPILSRILIKDQTSGFQNGIYDLTTTGGIAVSPILTRSLDYNTAVSINAGDLIPVINGTVNALTSWLQTATVTTVGTDALVFVEWTANPANYLLKANNLSDVTSASTSYKNISPLTTAGDLVYENATPTPARLPIGSTGNILTVSGGLPVWAAPATSGTVTSVSVVSANGLAGTVATATSTPAITLSTTITGLLKGNGTAISAAVSNTDYQAPISTFAAPANQFVTGFTAPNTFTAAQPSFSNLSGNITAAQMLALPSADLYVGNGSNVPAAVALSGDATISNTGALTIANLAITNAKIANATIDLTTKVTGVLPIANGGTSASTLTLNNVILGNGTSAVQFVAPGTSGNVLTSNGTTWTSSAAVDTGITQLTGDVTAGPGSGSQAATIANLAVTNAKIANATIDLTTKVTGLLPIANGGTGQSTANTAFNALSPMTTAGDIIYENATPVGARLAIGSTGQVLTVAGGLPSWATPSTNATTVSTTSQSGNTNYFLSFVAANSTTTQGISVGPATYNPSTGLLTATGFSGNGSALTNLNASNLSTGTVPVARATFSAQTLTETSNATTIDWSLGNTFTLTLNGNLNTVTFSNTTDGQVINVAITNTASNYTVTWGNSIKWSGGTQPVQTIGAFTDVWTIMKVGSTFYGSAVQNFS